MSRIVKSVAAIVAITATTSLAVAGPALARDPASGMPAGQRLSSGVLIVKE